MVVSVVMFVAMACQTTPARGKLEGCKVGVLTWGSVARRDDGLINPQCSEAGAHLPNKGAP